MKKTRKLIKSVVATAVLMASISFSGCMNVLDTDLGENGSKNISDVSSNMNRSAANNMVYMGGSVLFSEENEMANQLAPNVTVATRIGTVDTVDTGYGNTVGVHNKNATYGYIVINSVNMKSIAFDYYQYSEDPVNQKASFFKSFVLEAGNECDLNGDGVSDIAYSKPDAGTTARRHRMWLKFLRNGKHSSMFSVIADQYEGGNYPGGLFGINTEGRSIVTKYCYSNSNRRSAVASITNGDYVIDTVENKIAVYRGSSINKRSARALNDYELSVDEFNNDMTVENLEFKDYDFTSDFDIYKLLEALPSSLVKEAYTDKNITDAVAYLNKLLRQSNFADTVLSESTNENAAEIKKSLADYSFTNEMELVYIGRALLCELYPDLCPEMTSFTNGFGDVFPELFVSIGHTEEYENAPEKARAVIANIIQHDEFDPLYPTKDVEKYDQTFLDYAEKYDEIYKWFSTLYYVDISDGIMNDWLGEDLFGIEDKDLKGLYKDFVKNMGLKLMVGAYGSVSVANGNPKVEVKLAALAGFEIKNNVTFSLAKGSFFEKKPSLEKAPTALEKYKALYPNSSISTEEEAKKFFETDHGYKERDLSILGTTGWVDTKDIDTGDMPSLSKYAKFKHIQINPVKTIPLVVTFDLDFDILRSLKISAECDNIYIGGVVVAGVEGYAGLNWGFKKKVFGYPVPWSFYCNFEKGGNKVFEHAYFAGFPKKDIDNTKVGIAVKGQITPILKLRGGVGIGGDLWIAKTDITVGGSVTAAVPLTMIAGVNYSIAKGINVKVSADAKLMINWGLDAQFYIDPPLVDEIKKTFPIYTSDVVGKFQLFKVTSENFGTPKWEGLKVLDI